MKRGSWPLAALAALFFGPLLIAIILYAVRGNLGGFGQLPNPDRELFENPSVLPLAPLTLADGSVSESDWARSRWSLIYARMPACDTRCDAALESLHQVYLALGGERDRVQLIYLGPAGGLPRTLPADYRSARIDGTGGAALGGILGAGRLAEGRYFVVDPLGNVILSYPDDADQSRLLKDLERLLDVSRVG